MDDYFYKNLTSGRTTFVRFNSIKKVDWTNEKMPVNRLSIQDLKPFYELKGSVVELNGHKGTITGCCAIDSPLEGKYLKDNRYAAHKRLLNMNNLVKVHWYTGVNQCWQKFDELKLV